MSCYICGTSPCDNAHFLKSRGAGGKDDQIIPLCRVHHSEQHQKGISTFMRLYSITERDIETELQRIKEQLGE